MHCCHEASPGTPTSVGAPAGWPRRLRAAIQWAIPAATLALIPKCPACLAAYFFLLTGMGLSFQAAAAARWAMMAVSIAALGYLVFRAAWRVRCHARGTS